MSRGHAATKQKPAASPVGTVPIGERPVTGCEAVGCPKVLQS